MLAGPGGGEASTSSAESAAGGASTAPAIYVGPTGTVIHERHPYSMPAEAISMPGKLYLCELPRLLHFYAERVRIVAGRCQGRPMRRQRRTLPRWPHPILGFRLLEPPKPPAHARREALAGWPDR